MLLYRGGGGHQWRTPIYLRGKTLYFYRIASDFYVREDEYCRSADGLPVVFVFIQQPLVLPSPFQNLLKPSLSLFPSSRRSTVYTFLSTIYNTVS